MYHEITQIMYDDVAYAWMGQFKGYYVFRDNLHGMYYNPISGGYDYSTIYLTPKLAIEHDPIADLGQVTSPIFSCAFIGPWDIRK